MKVAATGPAFGLSAIAPLASRPEENATRSYLSIRRLLTTINYTCHACHGRNTCV